MMPTKARKAREREKKARNEELDKAFAVLPGQFTDADMSLNEIIQKEIGFYSTNLCKHNENGEPYKAVLHPEKSGNDRSAEAKRAEALRLKGKYPQQWCKRGGAKIIAIAEGINIAQTDNLIRKIQKYFRDFP